MRLDWNMVRDYLKKRQLNGADLKWIESSGMLWRYFTIAGKDEDVKSVEDDINNYLKEIDESIRKRKEELCTPIKYKVRKEKEPWYKLLKFWANGFKSKAEADKELKPGVIIDGYNKEGKLIASYGCIINPDFKPLPQE
jgi:hypothetical protein